MLKSEKYFLIVLLIVFLSTLAYSQQVKYETVPAKEGERCIVCGIELSENDIALIIKGRRIPLKPEMLADFMKDEKKYFAKLQPRGALFQESFDAPAGTTQGGISLTWFLSVLYIITALTFAGINAYVAVGKGLTPTTYFFAGLFFHAFGFLYTLTRAANKQAGTIPAGLKKVPATHSPYICTICGMENHPSAKLCSGCDVELKPLMESETSKVIKES